MSNTVLNLIDKQIVSVRGLLDHDHAMKLFANGRELIASHSNLKFDLSQVERSDSAGLALLLAWLKEARQANHEIHFVNPPQQMENLASLTGLTALLGFDDETKFNQA